MTSRAMTTSNDDPWAEISPTGAVGLVSARRVAASGRWSLFWARDNENHRLLLFKHHEPLSSGKKLPRLKGLELVRTVENSGAAILVLRLLDPTLREPFHTLCCDIVEATEAQAEETGAVAAYVMRTWRWHFLLRGGQKGLSLEQQKGLAGEMLTLRDVFLPKLGALASVEAWCGPLGAAQDFRWQGLAVECKASRGAGSAHVVISSEHQLDAEQHRLFLRVLDIRTADAGAEGAFALRDLVEGMVRQIEPFGQAALDLFLGRVEAAGFRVDEDESQQHWTTEPALMVAVTEEFPRITPSRLPIGIFHVGYSLAVSALQPFLVDEGSIWPEPPNLGP